MKIKELEELLRKERENLQGSAKEREEQLKREIEDWKKRLQAKEKENEELLRQIKALEEDKAGLLK
jgi:septal ring factor EnvC (AmiA/AmiB activator)